MIKTFLLGLLVASLSAAGALAQTVSSNDSGAAAVSPAPGKAKAEATPQGPTVIDSNSMDYDEKTRIAVFTGEYYGVFVKDPSFTVYCDKLTAHMRKGGAAAGPKGKPAPTPAGKPPVDAAAQKAGGLQSAFAEGVPDRPVVIVQDKPATNGDEAQHNVGIAATADYNADTGDVVLKGWPRVTQGINTQVATASWTIMTMNKDGKTMKTQGPSRTIITEKDQPKKDDANSGSKAPSPQ